jgi:hypothetical protein
MRLSPTIMPHQSVPYHNMYHASLPYLSKPASNSSCSHHHSGFLRTDRQQVLIIKSQLLGRHRTRQIDPSTDLRFKISSSSSTSHGYHLSSHVVKSASRALSQSSFASGVGPVAFGSQRTFSSSTVEDGRCPTFLLGLRLRQRNLVCLLDSGLDDLLLFGREGGGELGVELGLRFGQSWREILLARCGWSEGVSCENLH